MLGHQYKAEAKKLLEMSKHQFQTLDSLIKELASDMVEASGPDENHESCSSDDEWAQEVDIQSKLVMQAPTALFLGYVAPRPEEIEQSGATPWSMTTPEQATREVSIILCIFNLIMIKYQSNSYKLLFIFITTHPLMSALTA